MSVLDKFEPANRKEVRELEERVTRLERGLPAKTAEVPQESKQAEQKGPIFK